MLAKKVAFAFLCFIPLISFGQGGLLVRPVKLEFNLDKGQHSNQVIYMKNNLDKKMQFKIYLGDWLRDSMGGHKYMAPGTNGFSCADWIKLDQEFIELASGESKAISVTLDVPDTDSAVDRMKWAMIFVENIDETTAPNAIKGLQAAVKQVMRIGIHVYETPPNIVSKDIRMLGFENVPGADKKYRILCQNTGAVQMECKSYLELLNLTSGVKTKIDYPDFPTFPGQIRFIDYDFPESMPSGKYQVLAVVDAGEDVPLEASQTIIEIK